MLKVLASHDLSIVILGCGISKSHRDEGKYNTGDELHDDYEKRA